MTRAILLLAVVAMSGCASMGPGTVTRDRFDYTEAIAESWKSQMLLNLMKIRYNDAPVFLALLPFFAVKELGRVLGRERIAALFFRSSVGT
jgi:hypothetical protein